MKLIAVALTVKTSVGEWFGSVKLLDSHTHVAESLGVNRSTVSRTLQLFHASGSVAKKLYPKDKTFRKLTPAKLLILNLVIKKPGIYREETQGELLNVLLLELMFRQFVDFCTIMDLLAKNCAWLLHKEVNLSVNNTFLMFQYTSQKWLFFLMRLVLTSEMY